MKEEALAKNILPREVADQILKDYFGIKDEENDYQTALAMVSNEVDQYVLNNSKGTFTLLDFESFRSIGKPALRSAVGRGIAKYLKGREEVDYLRDDEGNICRTNNHAAIYSLKKGNKE
ncbi:hypothetical protein [Ligilactobacillus ruminis]|uniref:hypothetical protein n=1 Tax=Ligilactobacillus ruminis TaxID=1623 RepID=UPI003F9E0EDA